MASNRALTLYVASFVDELTRSGVENVVISPGSRSTPMSMVMAEHPELKIWLEIDERSAGFFALGMAKAKREPIALVCTSGTAAANYMPAIVEAYLSRIPLIVITTDRPHELRDVGAPQAIDQINLYGKYAKWFVEMALPEEDEAMLRYVRTVAGRAVATAASGPAGVVHLNFPFREPLIPDFTIENLFSAGSRDREPYVATAQGVPVLEPSFVQELSEYLLKTEKGLIICGPYDDPMVAKTVTLLAEKLNYPILADPLSQLRSGEHKMDWIIDTYDTFLRDKNFSSTYKPDVVVRFGAMPISKALLLYLKQNPATRQIIIDEDGGWREPTLMASDMVFARPDELFQNLLESQPIQEINRQEDWSDHWLHTNQTVRRVLMEEGKKEILFEGQIIQELIELLPEEATLFVGNSMPVRDLDSFFLNNNKQIRTMANRGANGIDGVVSSALGAATVGSPLVLMIGDLSFYHDLNGLLATKLHPINITIILVNNDGGGIFSFLPQANHPKHFEQLFGTPLGLDYRQTVEMYGGRFHRIQDWTQFRERFKDEIKNEGLSVIEVPTIREENVVAHRDLWEKAFDAVGKVERVQQ